MIEIQGVPSAVVAIGVYAAAVLGGFCVLSFVKDVVCGIYGRLLRPGKNLKKYGSWAVVTGATDGIGYAMAMEFAKKGLNVLIISRSKDKLEKCQKEIAEKYNKIEVKTLDIDYSKFDEAARARVAAFIADLDIGILVNNVGMSYPFTKYFHELTDGEVANLMTLNVDSTTWMTRLVLPCMLKKHKGAIVNIGSAAGVSNNPLLAEYSAAKSYVTAFSKALDTELKGQGIDVQCQVALFVATKLAKLKKASLFVASPSGYARAAVASIGYEAVVSPFWSHALQVYVLTHLPDWIVGKIILNMHMGIRKAGMKKEAAAKLKST
jgi:17beta-estradiol 17-dehydrogenase / very-long-chain 3-oxoacyl-CoA reductase